MKKDPSFYRILDANFNRSREALRVCEDIFRFVRNDRAMSAAFKSLRHRVTSLYKTYSRGRLLLARDVRCDVGRKRDLLAMKKDWKDVLFANLERAKESVRVLEEISKLTDLKKAQAFKKIRFQIYAYEKKCLRF